MKSSPQSSPLYLTRHCGCSLWPQFAINRTLPTGKPEDIRHRAPIWHRGYDFLAARPTSSRGESPITRKWTWVNPQQEHLFERQRMSSTRAIQLYEYTGQDQLLWEVSIWLLKLESKLEHGSICNRNAHLNDNKDKAPVRLCGYNFTGRD